MIYNYKYIQEINHLKKLTLDNNSKEVKLYLEKLPRLIKGPGFVEYLALLYRGNGWVVIINWR